jgi:hypothetical protein
MALIVVNVSMGLYTHISQGSSICIVSAEKVNVKLPL